MHSVHHTPFGSRKLTDCYNEFGTNWQFVKPVGVKQNQHFRMTVTFCSARDYKYRSDKSPSVQFSSVSTKWGKYMYLPRDPSTFTGYFFLLKNN